jgi:hypothetical protein
LILALCRSRISKLTLSNVNQKGLASVEKLLDQSKTIIELNLAWVKAP